MRPIDADAAVDDIMSRPPDMGVYTTSYIVGWLRRLPAIGGWISVKDRLPENARFVLICVGRAIPKIGRYLNEDGWWIPGSGFLKTTGDIVTHWMPLPELPKEE